MLVFRRGELGKFNIAVFYPNPPAMLGRME